MEGRQERQILGLAAGSLHAPCASSCDNCSRASSLFLQLGQQRHHMPMPGYRWGAGCICASSTTSCASVLPPAAPSNATHAYTTGWGGGLYTHPARARPPAVREHRRPSRPATGRPAALRPAEGPLKWDPPWVHPGTRRWPARLPARCPCWQLAPFLQGHERVRPRASRLGTRSASLTQHQPLGSAGNALLTEDSWRGAMHSETAWKAAC